MDKKTCAFLMGLGMLCSIPLFSEGLVLGDDIHYHLTRIEGIYQGLRGGEFPVRINSMQNAGFGNLSATMYPQLFLYPAALLRLLGMPLIGCYKALLTAVNIATAFCAYLGARGITKSHKMAMTAACLYTFAGYRLSNIYFRGALGETLAMVFLPIVLWGVYEVLWGDRKNWPVLMLGVTGVVQSHVLSLEMILVFGVLEFVCWLFLGPVGEKLSRIGAGLLAAVVTVLLNAGFLVPFLYFSGEELQCFYIPNELRSHVLYISQMFSFFSVPEGGTQSLGTTQGEMPLSVGGILLLGSVLSVLWLTIKEKDKVLTKGEGVGKHCLIYGVFALLLCTWVFPWEQLLSLEWFGRVTASLQFPWRFLSLATLFLTIASAVAIVGFGEERNARWLYGFFVLVLAAGTGFFFDALAHNAPQTCDEAWVESMMVSDSNYMYREGDSFQALHLNYSLEDAYVKAKGEVSLSDYVKCATSIRLQATAGEESELLFPLYYFPGYRVLVNGERTPCYRKDTLVACRIPEGSSRVEIRYIGLPAFWAGDIVSWFTAAGLAFFGGRKAWKLRPQGFKFGFGQCKSQGKRKGIKEKGG
ncbi:MAG: YfhO family protein [Roseburia sp.]|nr:YfhO family protein [Roseburia sp.]